MIVRNCTSGAGTGADVDDCLDSEINLDAGAGGGVETGVNTGDKGAAADTFVLDDFGALDTLGVFTFFFLTTISSSDSDEDSDDSSSVSDFSDPEIDSSSESDEDDEDSDSDGGGNSLRCLDDFTTTFLLLGGTIAVGRLDEEDEEDFLAICPAAAPSLPQPGNTSVFKK